MRKSCIITVLVDIQFLEPKTNLAAGSEPMIGSSNMNQSTKAVPVPSGGTVSGNFNTYYQQQTEVQNNRFFSEEADRKQKEAKERAERGS